MWTEYLFTGNKRNMMWKYKSLVFNDTLSLVMFPESSTPEHNCLEKCVWNHSWFTSIVIGNRHIGWCAYCPSQMAKSIPLRIMNWLCKIASVLILINLTVIQLTNWQRISQVKTIMRHIIAPHGAFCEMFPVREPPTIKDQSGPTAILQIILKTILL